jgi:predicted nucleic acid-binding protein
MYLVKDAGGSRGQRALWEMVGRGLLELVELDARAVDRMRQLMEKYKDLPMSLADASLVAVADERGIRRVFTLDSDFSIYRRRRRGTFEVVP